MIKSTNGTRGWACYQAYLSFIFYMHMTSTAKKMEMERMAALTDPKLKNEGSPRERAIEYFLDLDDDAKKIMIIECLEVARIPPEDMIAFCSVHTGLNGTAITASTINNYSIPDMAKMIIESTLECSNISSELFF